MRFVLAVFALLIGTTSPAASAEESAVAEELLSQWDRLQMLLEVSERCPTLAPYMRWGLAAQKTYLEDPKSPLGQILAVEAKQIYGPGEEAFARYLDDFFADRTAKVRGAISTRSCGDPEIQSMALQMQPVARFGLFEKLYVFTRVKGGMCAPPELAAGFGPTLAADMKKIAQTLPEANSLKAQVDGLPESEVEDHCLGSGATRQPTDPMTGNMLYDYMAEIEQRANGYPYELILPLIPTSAEAPSYMAWRDREESSGGQVAAGLLASGVCLAPMQKLDSAGRPRGLTDAVELYFGVDRDGNLAVQLGADEALSLQEVQLDVIGGSPLAADREVPAVAVTGKAKARLAGQGSLKRYVFDLGNIDAAMAAGAPVAVKLKLTEEGARQSWLASGCAFDLSQLYQAYGWARELGGIGKAIQ